MTAMVAASFAQNAGFTHAIYPALTGLNPIIPVAIGLLCGLAVGLDQRRADRLHQDPALHRHARHDGVSARRRRLVHRRPTGQQPRGLVRRDRRRLVAGRHLPGGGGVFHVALRYTRYGKFTYAIGANPLAARVSGINVERHLLVVYTFAGLLSGLAGVVTAARAITGQAGMGVGFELDAIAAAVIGGTSLAGGVGRMTGTVIGTVILGILTSGFTFLNVDAHYQEIIKGGVIIAAVITDQYRLRKRRKA